MYHRFGTKRFFVSTEIGWKNENSTNSPQTMPLIAWVSVLCNNSVDFAHFSCHIAKMIGRAQTNHL